MFKNVSIFVCILFATISISCSKNKYKSTAKNLIEYLSSDTFRSEDVVFRSYLSDSFAIPDSILMQIFPSLKQEIKTCNGVKYVDYNKLNAKEKNIELEGVNKNNIVVVQCNSQIICFILFDKKDKIRSFVTINKNGKRYFVL